MSTWRSTDRVYVCMLYVRNLFASRWPPGPWRQRGLLVDISSQLVDGAWSLNFQHTSSQTHLDTSTTQGARILNEAAINMLVCPGDRCLVVISTIFD